MGDFNPDDLKKVYTPPADSHKGQNGKLLVIGGSKLFHAASLWSLEIASKIVDMVFYSSVEENNEMVQKAKEEFRNGIVVPRSRVEDYIQEADCILIGPGLPRPEGQEDGDDDTKELTEKLLQKYPHKKWVIDGGSLQTIDPELIPRGALLTPHVREFETLFSGVIPASEPESPALGQASSTDKEIPDHPKGTSYFIAAQVRDDKVQKMAKRFNCFILLKGPTDIIGSPSEVVKIPGGNAGMTKGGTGDVLAGLVAALGCKNDLFLAAKIGSYINKKAAESLAEKVGLNFNSSDLVAEIPLILKKYL